LANIMSQLMIFLVETGVFREIGFQKLTGISNNSFWQASESFRFWSASDKTCIIFK